jgi:hypothetical protein
MSKTPRKPAADHVQTIPGVLARVVTPPTEEILFNVHPADELAELREKIKVMTARADKLRDKLLEEGADLRGDRQHHPRHPRDAGSRRHYRGVRREGGCPLHQENLVQDREVSGELIMPKKERTLFAPQPPTWKVRDMVEKLGGVGALTDKLMTRGFFPPGADTVQGWVTRNSLPGSWSPAVFALAQAEGLIEDPMDALVRDFRLKKKRNRK